MSIALFASIFLLINVLVHVQSDDMRDQTPKPGHTPRTPRPTGPTTAPGAGKVNCGVCKGPGNDCKPTSVDKNCDFCAKITGTVDDPNKVPSTFFSLLQLAGLGDVKSEMQANKGKQITIRKGAPQALVALAGQNFNDEGCTDYPSILGLNNAHACLCKGDCE